MPRLTTAVWRHRRQQMNDLMDALRLDALVFTSADFFQFATISIPTCCPGSGPYTPWCRATAMVSW